MTIFERLQTERHCHKLCIGVARPPYAGLAKPTGGFGRSCSPAAINVTDASHADSAEHL